MPTIPVPGPTPAPTPHQHGGIVLRPHVGLVGEAGPEAIIPLGRAAGVLGHMLGGVTVNAPITIGAEATEHANLSAILAEHAREIAREVQRVLQLEAEQAAVV